MPHELKLSFKKLPKDAPLDSPVPVSVHYEGQDTEEFEFINPLTDQDLADLRWYLELYWQWPVGPDYDRARSIETRLPGMGRDLSDAIFEKSAKAMRIFATFLGNRDPDSDSIITIDTTEPRILRLPWELLADEGGYMFTKDPAVSVRRRMHKTSQSRVRQFDLPLRILMVVSRPDDGGFFDPRSSAQPLLDATDPLGDEAVVEFLRPPTLTALTRRLRNPRLPKVHVVHFDGHGAYDESTGLGVLLFEKNDHTEDRVDAEKLGTLLNETGIPLVILDACQSAQPDERNPFGSVASRLIESGVGGVVAMNYSVLVETSKRLIRYFYRALADGQNVSSALDSARIELLSDADRIKLYRPGNVEETIQLQDWFVPALYQQSQELRPFSSQSAAPPKKRIVSVPAAPERGGFPPEPQHGFHGRAKELLDLERAFAKNSIEVLHGFGGQGKTALGAHTARWLVRTGRFDRAVFVSFETGAGLDVVLAEMGTALVGKDFKIHEGDPIQAIADDLDKSPTLVVWDNFETVLPGGSIPLSSDALQELLNAGVRWFGRNDASGGDDLAPRSCLLITTRNPDIPHASYAPGSRSGIYPLPGLNEVESLELAGTILANLNLPRPPRESLSQLLDFLGGHPLSIQLVIPHLGQGRTAEKLIDEFEALLPGFKLGAGKERNQSLEVSLQYSLAMLDEETRTLLPRLFAFRGGAFENVLLAITEINEDTWQRIRTQLEKCSLLRVEHIPGINPPFLRFHPTLAPYLAKQISKEQQAEIETRYWQQYYGLANFLYSTDRTNPYQARAIAVIDMPNMRRALSLALEAREVDHAVEFADSINRFLGAFGRWRERDDINEMVRRAVGDRKPDPHGKISKSQYLIESQRIDVLLNEGRAGEAEMAARNLLKLLEDGVEFEASYQRLVTMAKIGRSLEGQGKAQAASEQYLAAIVYGENLDQTDNVRQSIGNLNTDLADTFVALGEYDQAQTHYETALGIDQSLGDYHGAAVDLGQLGTLALMHNDLQEAKRRHKEALKIFQGLDDAKNEAAIWHQLGIVAQEAKDWEEAERCYGSGLAIRERLGDVFGQGQTCGQLGFVARDMGRPDDAERWLKRAVGLFEKVGARKEIAMGYSNLANLMLSQQDRLDEAEDYAHRSRKIVETLDLSAEPWKDYSILANIAERRGRPDQALEWRRKEQESYAAFAGSDQSIERWKPLIALVVAACQGDQEAASQLELILQKMDQTGDWHNLIQVIKRVLAGERSETLCDGLDRTDGLIVRRILEILSGQGLESTSSSPYETEPESEEGLTLEQLLSMVEEAARGNVELRDQLLPAMDQMAQASEFPPELRSLSEVLGSILKGDLDPNMDALTPELATLIREMVVRIKQAQS